ncbi:MAG TPA: two-component regulator propeller domain-containing protein [Bryobacteraceae bacterium]|nr:two-component regulator propeller domain-containing protein [Bryobacteraceae bacterium]
MAIRGLAGIALFLAAATASATQLPVHIYTAADGLARNATYCIFADSKGFLWLCTAEGISRFDGYSFVNYGVAEGLPSRSVNAFLETSGGVYLAATDNGIARLDPAAPPRSAHQFRSLGITGPVYALLEDRAGTVWAGATGGLYRIRGQTVDRAGLPTPAGDIVRSLAADAHDNLWAGTSHGICRLAANGTSECFGAARGLPGVVVNAVLVTREGKLWAGTLDGLWRIAIDSTAPRAECILGNAAGLPTPRIHSLFQDSGGTLWVGTAHSLSQLSGGRFVNYSQEEGLSGRAVLAIGQDRQGNLWAGVDHGLARIVRNGFTTFTAREGMANRSITGLFEIDGSLYAVSNEGSAILLHRFSAGAFTSVRPRYPPSIHYFGWASNQSALVDRNGEWWIATGEGLCRFPRVNFEQLAQTRPRAVYTTRDGLPSNDIFRLYQDLRGDIWITTIGNGGGPSRWEPSTGRLHHYTQDEIPGYASAYAEDRAGNLWIGVSNDASSMRPNCLVRYREGRFERFTSADGVPPGWISALFVDGSGSLWVASSDGGAGHAADPGSAHPRFTSFTTAGGLSSVTALRIGQDQAGRIYIGTARALDRLDPASGLWKHYSTADGLAGGSVSAILRDGQGTMWFGTTMGISRMTPETESPRATPPVYITALEINGEPRAVTDPGARRIAGMQLTPSQRHVHIEYVAVGEAVEYQYQLVETDRGWSPPSEQRSVDYAGLPPGNYHFLVRAAAPPGSSNPIPAEVMFHIATPLWGRSWFLTLLAAGIAGAMFGGHRYHLARRLELERVRLRIAADLHDDLGASLTRVAILSEIAHRQAGLPQAEPGRHLTEIAETARGLVDGLSDIVWSIDPRRDDMRNLVRRLRQLAGETLEPLGVEWRLDAAAGIEHLAFSPDQRRNLFLIVKEAVHNAARHSGCRRLAVQIEVRQGRCLVTVSDDGRGFPDGDAESGNGLANMRARAAALGGSIAAGTAPGGGAEIVLSFPLSRPHKYALPFGLRNGG